jgi:MFS family permease
MWNSSALRRYISRNSINVGYLNSVAGPINTIFYKLYPDVYPNLPTTPLVPSITFVGLLIGQLLFGFISDKCGRRVGMVSATIIVVLFSAICAGAWTPSVKGMMIMFTVARLCLGVGIGAEYPAGSVAASEATAEMNPGRRHGMFILVTNFVIDLGFVVGNLVPCILVVFSLPNLIDKRRYFRKNV